MLNFKNMKVSSYVTVDFLFVIKNIIGTHNKKTQMEINGKESYQQIFVHKC